MRWAKLICYFVSLMVFRALPLPSVNGQSENQQANKSVQSYKDFKAFYEQKLRENRVVGSSFMLIHNNHVIAKEFFGLADKEQNRAVDEDTIYHWASITKTFTGIAIMQLRDHGKLKLDDPIIKYVPELKDVHNPYGDMAGITIRHLLSHSAGFRSSTWPWGGDKEWHPFEPQHWSQLVAMMPYTEILFKPGSKYSYSNPGFIFLGRVIESLSHDDFEVYIDKNILKPLEMYRSYFDTTPYHLLKHRAHSYWLKNGALKPARFDFDTGITVSNGGLNAPLTDMVKCLNFMTGDSKKTAIYDGVLKRSSLEEMWHPQLNNGSSLESAKRPKLDVGLAFLVQDRFDQRFIGHHGEQNAFLADLWLRPDSRTAFIVAYNTEEAENHEMQREISSYLFKNIFPLF